MGFSIQLHIVEDQQLVPGRAKGLIENLEERERETLLLQIGAKPCEGQQMGHWSQPGSTNGLLHIFFGPVRHGVSPKDSSEKKTPTQQQASRHKLFPASTRLAKAWQPSTWDGETQDTLQHAPVSPNRAGES